MLHGPVNAANVGVLTGSSEQFTGVGSELHLWCSAAAVC